MTGNAQGRKWLITINNPFEHEFTHENIKSVLMLLASVTYWCMVDEIGEQGTYHIHIFIYSQSPIRFSTLKNAFNKITPNIAHLDRCIGTVNQNRHYLLKDGKWAETKKSDTTVEGTFEEFGIPPDEKEERNPEGAELIELVKQGYTNIEIIETNPGFIKQLRNIDLIRQAYKQQEIEQNSIRQLEVTYLYGDPGTGKTKFIFDKYNLEDFYRITNYPRDRKIKFDDYNSNRVLVFEEFASQVDIEEMLTYLDIYPLILPARYNNKVANYKVVYLTSNLSLEEQYKDIQKNYPKQYQAFLRRIHNVIEFKTDGSRIVHKGKSLDEIDVQKEEQEDVDLLNKKEGLTHNE